MWDPGPDSDPVPGPDLGPDPGPNRTRVRGPGSDGYPVHNSKIFPSRAADPRENLGFWKSKMHISLEGTHNFARKKSTFFCANFFDMQRSTP